MGFSTPSTSKARGASPLNSLRSVIGVQHPLHEQSSRSLPAQLASLGYWGSAPPPRAKLAEPPRSTRFARLLGFSTPSTSKARGASPLNSLRSVIGVQHPLHEQSSRSLPAQLASLGYWGSAPPLITFSARKVRCFHGVQPYAARGDGHWPYRKSFCPGTCV